MRELYRPPLTGRLLALTITLLGVGAGLGGQQPPPQTPPGQLLLKECRTQCIYQIPQTLVSKAKVRAWTRCSRSSPTSACRSTSMWARTSGRTRRWTPPTTA